MEGLNNIFAFKLKKRRIQFLKLITIYLGSIKIFLLFKYKLTRENDQK
jgi:hypothetical protein